MVIGKYDTNYGQNSTLNYDKNIGFLMTILYRLTRKTYYFCFLSLNWRDKCNFMV